MRRPRRAIKNRRQNIQISCELNKESFLSHLKHKSDLNMQPKNLRTNSANRQNIAANLVTRIALMGLWLGAALGDSSLALQQQAGSSELAEPQEASQFPGVAPSLQSFCSARPSLPVDIATMIVHVKRNTSFNYKLYLFSGRDFVFQTGQIVPRDDFRVHSFPVKMKTLHEFWPNDVPVYRTGTNDSRQPASGGFDLHRFFAPVPLLDYNGDSDDEDLKHQLADESVEKQHRLSPRSGGPSGEHETALSDLNAHIQFDRDDQLAPLSKRRARDFMQAAESARAQRALPDAANRRPAVASSKQQTLVPVGAFSSFQVNTTYLVRKDFDQTHGELIRVVIDAARFQVSEVQLLRGTNDSEVSSTNSTSAAAAALDEASFLSHKLLRDPDTRITSITQVYENWITRNFYTIVYVQRRLPAPEHDDNVGSEIIDDASSTSRVSRRRLRRSLVAQRLVFRGSSAVLLGADQLDHTTKASAFITEKNGLHYFLEFVASKHKFFLGAVDWSKRPFRIIDARGFPMKQTRTLHDNEELLLCPPAVCYAEQPIDELAAYGRLEFSAELQREADQLASTSASAIATSKHLDLLEHAHDEPELAELLLLAAGATETGGRRQSEAKQPLGLASSRVASLARLESDLRRLASSLEPKLHLRDWTWTLDRESGAGTGGQPSMWSLRFDSAKRNELKAHRDSYGFALSGHEIDASYRVYNLLVLVSDNQLISIDYSQPNETVVSSRLVGEQFPGLSSTLIDPITAAFYERRSNELFFFKGDRYVGYDYATKKPLEDFQLPAPRSDTAAQGPVATASESLVSTLPVVELLGRQLHVDAIYHDLRDDLVYVFAGTKFHVYNASEFINGPSSRHERARVASTVKSRCINRFFLLGCQFDSAYPNSCMEVDSNEMARNKARLVLDSERPDQPENKPHEASRFRHDQQSRLRSIAAGRQGGLFELVLGNTLLSSSGNESSVDGGGSVLLEQVSSPLERIVMYLMVAMVALTFLLTIVIIVVLVQWAHGRNHKPGQASEYKHNGSNLPPIKPLRHETRQRHLASSATQLPPRLQQMLEEQQRQQLHYAASWLDNRNRVQPQHRVIIRQHAPQQAPVAARRSVQARQQNPPTPAASHYQASGNDLIVDSSAL